MKRLPVTDLFEEYKNDLRWVKTFYLPEQMTAVDMIFCSSLTPIQKEAFQDEETRLFNLVMKHNTNDKGGNFESHEQRIKSLSKLDFKPFVYALSADFFMLPDKKKVFARRIHKFFDLVKAWTSCEHINVDMNALEKFVADEKVFKRVLAKLSAEFKMASKFKENTNSRRKSFTNNLVHFHENFSKSHPDKTVFVTETLNLDNDIFLLDAMLKFTINNGIEKLAKMDQSRVKAFISEELILQMVNRMTKTWGKIRHFQHSLNNGEYVGEGLGISDETEFNNLHKLLPLIYGPTSTNFKYYSKQGEGRNQRVVVVGIGRRKEGQSVPVFESVGCGFVEQFGRIQLQKKQQVPEIQTES